MGANRQLSWRLSSLQHRMGVTMSLSAAFKHVKHELVVLLLIFGYATHYYLEVSALPDRTLNLLLIGPVYTGLVVAILLLVLLKLREAKREARDIGSPEALQQDGAEPTGQTNSFATRSGIVFAVSTIAYVLLFDKIGFVVSSYLYVMVLVYLLGNRSFRLTVLLPAIVVGSLYFATVALNLPVPTGWLI